MTRADELFSRLNPKIAAKFQRASEIKNEKQRLPSIGLTRALGGGIGYGRMTMFWGNRSASKTAHLIQTAGMAQKDDRGVAWIDAERNFDKDWAQRLGMNVDDAIVTPITSISDMADAGVDIIKAGYDIMIVDSISALLPNSYLVEGELKEFDKTQQIGTFSKNMGAAANMLNAINKNTAIVFISQVRNEFGAMHASLKPMGGKAMEHMLSTSIKIWSGNGKEERIVGNVHEGDLIFQQEVGRKVTWTVDKNRGPGMGASGKYNFYVAGDHVGIDNVAETLEVGVMYGKVKKGGPWYTIYGEKFSGEAKATDYLRENPEILEKLEAELYA